MKMVRPEFVIEASEAESKAQRRGQTLFQFLPTLVKSAQTLARPPISNFQVGAVGLGSSGRIFIGVNLEFPGLPLHHSVHAEQFLITNLSLHNETRLRCLAVSAAPCGHCRQFLQEVRDAPDIKIRITDQTQDVLKEPSQDGLEEIGYDPLSRFLPERFGPNDLLDKNVPLLLEPHNNRLSLLSELYVSHDLCNGVCGARAVAKEEVDLLTRAALEAANASHAPYSKCPSGVALRDSTGRVYKGSYMESAAYNPSLGPVQAALVAFVVGGGGGYEGIVDAVLVEREEAVVKQEHTARLLIQLVSPICEFRVVHCGVEVNKCTKASF